MTSLAIAFATLVAAQIDAGVAVSAEPPPIEPRVDEADDVADAGVADAGAAGANVDAGPTLEIAVSVTAEPVVAVFGEPFSLVISFARERGLRLELPGSIPDVDGAPRTGDPVRSVEELPGGRVKETIRVPYLALDTVDLKMPSFILTAPNGAVVDVPSLTVRVDVPPVDAGPAMTKDGAINLASAAPVITYPVADHRPWYVLAALVAVAAIAFVVRVLMKMRKAKPVRVYTPPPRPAHEIALERLEALLASGLLQKGETAPFVERLMDEVLRDYLEARFALRAGTRTTRELVKDMLSVAVAGLDVSLVESLLADADLVKFAKASIAAETAHGMARRVRALIEATAPTTTTATNTTAPTSTPSAQPPTSTSSGGAA